ncbi:AAA family ATPase, partial [Bacillus thuringiensis]|nr:AAA family ATPase [Bacillus thuringiensis]MEC2879686.1 AAA family ATPase [Bacillus cereus]MEC3147527.1 AAA family ATPase [Bacillus thuringiensis]MEC3237364.1 AAA family ATPase [Bacillus cereus]MEC3373497.1 AAA family ATPase [Bacillus cereus]
MADVKRAKIKLDVENGFSVNPGDDLQEVLKSLAEVIQSGTHNGVEVEIQYVDETEITFTDEEEEEEGEEEEEEEAEEEEAEEEEAEEDEED